MTVSEIEEGLFSKEVWFDTPDDILDEDKKDAAKARDFLLEDFELANAKDNLSEAVLVGAIYGTGIIKMNTDVVPNRVPVRNPETNRLELDESERVLVTMESIRPDEFIPDPAGRTIAEMQGCFHKVQKPLHSVLQKIAAGIYNESALATIGHTSVPTSNEGNQADSDDPQTYISGAEAETCEVLEYHGAVPLRLLDDAVSTGTPLDEMLKEIDPDKSQDPISSQEEMVEAIVTIANGNTILRAMANPFVMKDRSVIAYQFEKVPGRFWGRGVAEKGYNPQKALDAELRSRIDALGFISSPMIGIDSGRVPRGFKMEVKPGKVWMTQGPPREVITPVEIGNLQQATFNQADTMERMVQMGTGAFDTASALQGGNGQTQSGSQTSLMMGAFVKRSKRSIRNVNDNLITPVVQKAMWRYMQFDPNRYPQDYKFCVKPTLGIVAREVEAMQLTQLMGMLPDQYPQVNLTVAKGIIELSSVHNKAEVMASFEEALKPPSPEQQQKQQEMAALEFEAAKAEAESVLLENQKIMAETRKILADAMVADRRADTEEVRVVQEQERISIQQAELATLREQNQIAMKRLELQEKQVEAKLREMGSNKTSE